MRGEALVPMSRASRGGDTVVANGASIAQQLQSARETCSGGECLASRTELRAARGAVPRAVAAPGEYRQTPCKH